MSENLTPVCGASTSSTQVPAAAAAKETMTSQSQKPFGKLENNMLSQRIVLVSCSVG